MNRSLPSLFIALLMLFPSVFVAEASGRGRGGRTSFTSSSASEVHTEKIELEAKPYKLNITRLYLHDSPNVIVNIHPGEGPFLTVTTDAEVFGNIALNVNNAMGTIDISSRTQCRVAQFVVELTVPVNELNCSGGFEINAVIAAVPDFAMNTEGEINGAFQINAVHNVAINSEGESNLVLKGSADSLTCKCEGEGNITAHELQTHDSKLELSGEGTVSVSADRTLKADAEGEWKCSYAGTPAIDFNPSGDCKLRKI